MLLMISLVFHTVSPISSRIVAGFLCLDDTGSSNLTLFEADDLVGLGINSMSVRDRLNTLELPTVLYCNAKYYFDEKDC